MQSIDLLPLVLGYLSTSNMSDTADTKKSVLQAQAFLQQGHLEEALALIHPALADDPDDMDALYCAAVCYRLGHDFKAAKETLNHLTKKCPDFGRAQQEAGHLYRQSGEFLAAIAAYERAVKLNPALVACWHFLAELYTRNNQPDAAIRANQTAAHWRNQPPHVLAAAMHLFEGRLLKAEKLVRAFLQKNPRHVEAMRLLAELASRFGILVEAEFILESATEFEPLNAAVRFDYVQILKKRQRYRQALDHIKILREQNPSHIEYINQHAILDLQLGNFKAALAGFDQVLEKMPDDAGVLTSKGHALKTYGASDQAVRSYQQAHSVRPAHGDAYYGLANLKTYKFSGVEIDKMRQLTKSSDLAGADAVPLHFALAKAFEDISDFDRSFFHLKAGNDLKKASSRYDADQMDEEFSAQKTLCTESLFRERKDTGYPDPAPIFIVGLPRSGSTLIEQILASHSQVDGTLELPNIIALSHGLRGRKRVSEKTRYPAILRELDDEKLYSLGQRYVNETRIHRGKAPFFTDKMPNNFRHIGLISLILPKAKIIDARRAPMDCCFSGYKQLFAEGQEFSYSLNDIGRYYKGYVDLMDHWNTVLPGRIHRISHESLLDNFEDEVRDLLVYLDLPFEENCLAFHKTERAVRTASAEQVRRSLNRSGQDRWLPFEKYLDPLKQALGSLANSPSP